MPSCDGMHNLPRQIQGNSLGKKGNFDGEIKEIHLTKNMSCISFVGRVISFVLFTTFLHLAVTADIGRLIQ